MLTNTEIQNAKSSDKDYKLRDSLGLFLLVTARGSKLWRFNYRFQGKAKQISFGKYPNVSLKQARVEREKARQQVADGLDPSQIRKAAKLQSLIQSENTFEAIAREWLSKQTQVWAESHSKRILSRLERDLFPYLGSRPIGEIAPPEMLAVLRKVENRGAIETAHRELNTCGQIFRYAIATSRAERDISQDLRGALQPIKSESHFAAVTDPSEFGELLKMIDSYQGTLVVQCALRLAPLVFVRPGELRTAQWSDINFGAREWRFKASKTKVDHVVPLSRQAVAILEDLKPLTGRGEYVFPGLRSKDRPMSDNAILTALRTMGIPKDAMSGHGFRAIARTLLDEVLGYRVEIIEMQLAHRVKDVHGRAYNRTQFLEERAEMMQAWADYLEGLKR